MTYKWDTPYDWLRDKIQTGNETALRSIANTMLRELDADQIQDLFQEEMGADGYFEDVPLVRCPLGGTTDCHDPPCPHAAPHAQGRPCYVHSQCPPREPVEEEL